MIGNPTSHEATMF